MKKKILFGLSALMGLMMINSGLNKFLNFMPMPEMPKEAGALMMAFAESGWLLPLIALAEIVGGVLFIAPKFRALGAIVLLPVTVGILLFDTVSSPQHAGIAIVLILINFWAIYENKEKYIPMIQK